MSTFLYKSTLQKYLLFFISRYLGNSLRDISYIAEFKTAPLGSLNIINNNSKDYYFNDREY